MATPPVATVVAIQGNPSATTVGAMMPQVLPMGQIINVEGGDDETPVAVVTTVTTPTGEYFTPAQLAVMNGWQPVPDRPNNEQGTVVLGVVSPAPPGVNAPPPPPAGAMIGAPPPVGTVISIAPPTATVLGVATNLAPAMVAAAPFVTSSGVPCVPPTVRSGAETECDGWQGLKSCDPCLDSVDEILKFFQTHNSRPQCCVEVEGWHNETKTRRVEYKDDDGNARHREEEYVVRVSDFDYRIDLTNFIYPVGYIQSDEVAAGRDLDGDGSVESVPQMVERYLKDGNLLATVLMEKHIQGFDFSELCHFVRRHIRGLGWMLQLDVGVKVNNTVVRVYRHNACSALWENMCCFCLMHLTIIPCTVFRIYRDCGGHRNTGISSIFRMRNNQGDYQPMQVFDTIRPALWCPGWSGLVVAQQLLAHRCRW